MLNIRIAESKSDKQIAANTLWVGANLISNLGVLISPFLPKTSLKISSMFNFGNVIPEWKYREAKSGIKINNISPLFKKIEIINYVDDIKVEDKFFYENFKSENNIFNNTKKTFLLK